MFFAKHEIVLLHPPPYFIDLVQCDIISFPNMKIHLNEKIWGFLLIWHVNNQMTKNQENNENSQYLLSSLFK